MIRRLFIIAFILLFPVVAFCGFEKIVAYYNSASATSSPPSFAASAYGTEQDTGNDLVSSTSVSTTTGWTAVVFVRHSYGTGATISSVTDTASNTYISATTLTDNGDQLCQVFYCQSITGNAANVVSANFSSGASYCSILVYYIANAGTLDVHAQETPNTANWEFVSSPFSTARNDEIVIMFVSYDANNRTFSAGPFAGTAGTLGPCSNGSNGGDSGSAYRILSSTVTDATAEIDLNGGTTYNTIHVVSF